METCRTLRDSKWRSKAEDSRSLIFWRVYLTWESSLPTTSGGCIPSLAVFPSVPLPEEINPCLQTSCDFPLRRNIRQDHTKIPQCPPKVAYKIQVESSLSRLLKVKFIRRCATPLECLIHSNRSLENMYENRFLMMWKEHKTGSSWAYRYRPTEWKS